MELALSCRFKSISHCDTVIQNGAGFGLDGSIADEYRSRQTTFDPHYNLGVSSSKP